MRFLFLSGEPREIDGNTLEERPMGGGPSSVIRLSQALVDLGHEVYVVAAKPGRPYPSQPQYLTLDLLHTMSEVDVLILVSGWANLFFYPVPHKKCFYWTGDTMNNPKTLGMGDKRVVNAMNAFLPKSEWQAKTICEISGFPLEKTKVLANGVHLRNFEGIEKRNRKRLIYSSTPGRGLFNFIKYFPILRKKHLDVELYVFSSFDRYSNEWPPKENKDADFEEMLQELKVLPGCFVQRSLIQKDLAREFMKSSLLAYPTHFEETCCNTTLEAQAAGCAIITSDLASLPETVGDAGILIKGTPGQGEYDAQFIDAVDRVLSDDDLFHRLSSRALERAKNFDWTTRAQELIGMIS